MSGMCMLRSRSALKIKRMGLEVVRMITKGIVVFVVGS